MKKNLLLIGVCGLILLSMIAGLAVAHDSPVDHISRTIKLAVSEDGLFTRYRIQLTQRTALLELNEMDTDRNGQISDDERKQFFLKKSQQIAQEFGLEIDGKSIAVQSIADVHLDAEFGQTYLFIVPFKPLAAGKYHVRLTDRYSWRYPGPYRWLPQDVAISGQAQIQPIANPAITTDQKLETMMLEFDLTIKDVRAP